MTIAGAAESLVIGSRPLGGARSGCGARGARWALALLATLAAARSATAGGPPEPEVTIRVERLPADSEEARRYPIDFDLAGASGEARPGGTIIVRVRLRTRDGFHIYGPEEDGFAPTFFRAPEGAAVRVERIDWPPLKALQIDDFTRIQVFEDGVVVALVLRLSDNLEPGERDLVIDMGFGACDDESCLAPQEWKLCLRVKVTP